MIRYLGAVAALIFGFASPGWAAPPNINGAYLNLQAGTITIEGTAFGSSAAPIVTLAGSPLVVQQFTTTLIVAALPAGLQEGSYLLTVQRVGATATARFEVTADVEQTITYGQAIGGGVTPTATVGFFGAAATVTITDLDQRVFVTSSAQFATGVAAGQALNLFICYRQGNGPIVPVGNGLLSLRQPPYTNVTNGLSKVLTLPAVGTYVVGLCGTGGGGWIGNEWGATSALVF